MGAPGPDLATPLTAADAVSVGLWRRASKAAMPSQRPTEYKLKAGRMYGAVLGYNLNCRTGRALCQTKRHDWQRVMFVAAWAITRLTIVKNDVTS